MLCDVIATAAGHLLGSGMQEMAFFLSELMRVAVRRTADLPPLGVELLRNFSKSASLKL